MKDEILEDGTRRVTIDKSGKEKIEINAGQPVEVVLDLDSMISDRLWKLTLYGSLTVILMCAIYVLIRR